jgi:hypothetical protein
MRPGVRRSTVLGWLLAGVGALILLYYAFLFLAHDGNLDFLRIDSCLDRGGRWNYQSRTCER